MKNQPLFYYNLDKEIRKHSKLPPLITTLNYVLTFLVYLSFIYIIVMLVSTGNMADMEDAILTMVICGITLVILSFTRILINRPRPFNDIIYEPIIHRTGKNASMPSRHTFCVFIIAFAMYQVNIPLFVAELLIGVILAFLRVLGGVHYISDVVAGAIPAFVIGIIAFVIL